MVSARRVIWLFDPATALLGFSAASSVAGGAVDAKNSALEARDNQRDIDRRIEATLIGSGRDLRDNREQLKVDAARLRAMAASSGAGGSANARLIETRLVTESLIRDRRIEEDRDFTTNTLLERRRAAGREGTRKAQASLLGGAFGATDSILGALF